MANIIYTNQANKIFIYNSADEVVNTEELAEQKNTSSITILTSGIPEYHIRIKNNFKTEAKKNNNENFDESNELKKNLTDPQSCSMEPKLSISNLFSTNEDVLLKSIDDKLYLGTIVSIKNGKYLVKFDDNTEKWSCERGLQKLNSSLKEDISEDDPLCVVCKEKSETDVVEVCHSCSRGYHRHCTQRDSSNFSSPWCCDRCTANEIISISDSEDYDVEENDNKSNVSDSVKPHKRNHRHRENTIEVRSKAKRKRSQKFQEEKSEILERQQPIEDSSDESSSKSTLDWIIPPPSNFHGKNNPFHSQYKSNAKYKALDKSMKKRQNGFDKLPDIRIVRTIKRRLSAKDIAMGLNRDTKRRKIRRRKSCDIEIISEIIQPLNMPLRSYMPVRGGDARESKSTIFLKEKDDELDIKVSDESSKSMRMRRHSRSIDKIRNSIDSSTNGDIKPISLVEAVINSPVKSKSINMYFGALSRIENGERFKILAKRFTPDGKEQYLLDWDAPNKNGTLPATIKKEF